MEATHTTSSLCSNIPQWVHPVCVGIFTSCCIDLHDTSESCPDVTAQIYFMAITWSITQGRGFKAEEGRKCQQASVWLPGDRLIQEAGAEWATGCFWLCTQPAGLGAVLSDSGWVAAGWRFRQVPFPGELGVSVPWGRWGEIQVVGHTEAADPRAQSQGGG